MERAGARGHLLISARVAADYAREPLVLRNAAQDIDTVVSDQAWFHALASLAVAHRFVFSVDTNGWLEVKMGADGCVAEIAMDEPNADIVACLLAELGARRCPCGEDEIRYFFGLGNKGDCDAGAPPG